MQLSDKKCVSGILLATLSSWKNLFLFPEYTVYVKTGTQDFSGTDANVWIKIHGQNGVTGEKKLVNGRNAFEQGK